MEFIKSLLADVYVRLIAMWLVLQCRVWSFYKVTLVKLLGAMKAQVDARNLISDVVASKLPAVEGEIKRVEAQMTETGCRCSSGGEQS